ncbi:D-alanyl-D-alanine carboxypeptidase [Streptomyces gobitricini]|uniref:D-alanyl-D-alanine carboxypeptidase n=1 Tax=Streptomyces gobitricini TaxID=68211 RepID=A0ABN3LEJ8_9ACTN
MAGESPDKSEQQKSPGETASDERDPRLAVRGDAASPAGDAERSVDQPTAVFKAVPETVPEGSAVSEGSEVPGDRDGDARLRDAVAAWVTKADEPGGNDPAASGVAAPGPVGAAAAEPAGPAGPAGPVGAEEAADRPSGADDADSAGGADDADDAPVRSAEVSSEAAERAAGAADEVVGPSAEAAEPSTEAAGRAEPADEPVEPSRRGGASAGAAEPSPRAGAGSSAGDGKPREPADEAAEPSAKDEPSGEGEATAKGSGPATPAEEPAREGGREPVDQPTAVFRAVQRKPVDQPTTALKAITPTAQAADAAEAAESPAERTSKFVPLRPDDARPAAKKRETPAAATAATAAALTEPERTRQQPLPPRPPLDMLAELTNTPPPPETPVRTAVRRVKIWTPLALLLVIIFAIVQFVRPLPAPTLEMTAKSSYAFDGGEPSLPWPNEGQGYMSATGLGTVDSFGEQKPVPIGSVAKAMTAYVILKEHPLKKGSKGEMIEIDALAEKEGGYDAQNESTLNTVKAGDKITEYDALAAIMIPSANNIARLLARWDAGSEAAFVKKMNDTAKELGMKNTTYTDPSGLNHTTVSSAEDQVKLGEKLVEIPALLEITAMPWWTDPSGKKWRNYNDLVPYDGALGIKTGSTTRAGGNLLFAAHKKVGETDQLIVGAVLAQYKTPILGSAIAASKEAMLATQDLLASRTVVKKGDVVGHVDDGLGGTTPVVVTKDVKVVGWSGLTVKLELGNGGRALPHSAPAGTQVGVLTVGEGASQVRVPVALRSALAEPGLGDKLTRLG